MLRVPGTAAVVVLLLAGATDAALQTRTMDAVETEVRARAALVQTPQNRQEKKLKRVFKQVLKLFDKDSKSPKQDAKRVRSIVKRLAKALKDDVAFLALLEDGTHEFFDEFQDHLDWLAERLGRVDPATPRFGDAFARHGVAQGTIDDTMSLSELVKRIKKGPKVELRVRKALDLCSDVFTAHGPIDVHAFQYDLLTDEYIVPVSAGAAELVRVSVGDVNRDLVGSLCSRCHVDAVDHLKDSVHYKISGETQRVLFPGGGAHGMLDRACGLPATTGLTNSWSDINLGECGKCHVSRYLPVMEPMFTGMFGQMGVSDPAGEAEKLVNAGLDCLICHAEGYHSRPMEGTLAVIADAASPDGSTPTAVGQARDARDNADFDHDGFPDLVIDMDGDGTPDAPLMMDTDGDGTPETPWQTVAQDRGLEAMETIGPTDEHACLRCHEHARTGYKRGTLFIDGHDVHSTMDTGPFAGADNQCTVCHTADDHKFVRGHLVGGDLAAADYAPPPPGVAPDPYDPTDLTCETCHDASALEGMVHNDRHTGAIACETCHIPAGSGITYSLFGHGGQVSFARNGEGKDTKLVVADMYVAGDRADLDKDFEAYESKPILTWFNGGTSFLAQPLSVRGMPGTKITPFKPMANGMVFDSRFFSGETVENDIGVSYNAYSMFRFYANRMVGGPGNAEAFAGLGMLTMTPEEVRAVTLNDFFNPDPNFQAMALMQIFPNLVYFDKAGFGYEHYLTRKGSPHDGNTDGIIDVGEDFNFDMFAAANSGLRQFQGFNAPMGFPADYEWYPQFDEVSDVISMKLPDGSLIKMFLQMQAANLPPEQQGPYLDAVANYPSFSQITLGGHGVVPKEQALGNDCLDCHGDDGVLAHTVPVGQKVATDMGPMGTLEMPVYQWKYYNVQRLVDLGLTTTCEEVASGTVDVDIEGDATYVRDGGGTFVLNWMAPDAPGGYRPATDVPTFWGASLTADDLTWNGGQWMPVLEPVTEQLPNYAVLGYDRSEVIWDQ